MSGIFRLLFTRLTLPPPSAFEGQTILITGANTGIGLEAVRHAARLGADTIIMGVRDVNLGEKAKANVETSTGSKTKLLVWPVDLASFASVLAFAEQVNEYAKDGGKLNMAILNAGMGSQAFTRTTDGWEKSLQVNVLATAQLALHLMPRLLASAEASPSSSPPPHLTFLTSDSHMGVKFPERHNTGHILESMNDEAQWAMSQAAGGAIERYGVTKLLDLLLAKSVAERVPRRNGGNGRPLVVVNAVTPGFCKSNLLTRERAPLMLRVVQALIARPVEEGSKTLLHAATAGAETHGKYLDHQAIAVPGKVVTDAASAQLRESIWEETTGILLGVDPAVPVDFSG